MTNSTQPISPDTLYEQLNERSRMYTSQLWQVPGLYLALTAWILDKIPTFSTTLKVIICFSMAGVSLFVWVFVAQLKFLERRAIRQMQLLEGKALSTGGSPWFFSFIWYVRALLVFATFGFFLFGVLTLPVLACIQFVTAAIGGVIFAAIYFSLGIYDRRRSEHILNEIRNASLGVIIEND